MDCILIFGRDSLRENPYRSRFAVFSMSVPIFIETALQMMVPNVDQFMLSRYSQDAVAAVGNDNVVFNMIVLTLAVMCQAATILIAHYRGAGNMEKVSEVCTMALAANFVLGAAISALLFLHDEFFWTSSACRGRSGATLRCICGGSGCSCGCRACTWRSFLFSAGIRC